MRQGSIAVALAAVAVLAAGCDVEEADALGREEQRIRDADHWAVLDVGVFNDWLDGPELTVQLAPDVTNQDARDVWCDVILASSDVKGWSLGVYAERDGWRLWWDQPKSCANPDAIPKPIKERIRKERSRSIAP